MKTLQNLTLALFATSCLSTSESADLGIGSESDSGGSTDEFRTVIQYSVSESYDQCCTTGTDYGCYPDNNNTCPAGKSLTGCFECGFSDCGDEGVGWMPAADGPPYQCNGFSWRISTGAMIDDDCITQECVGELCQLAWPFEYECPMADWTLYNNTNYTDGTVGRMCCKDSASADNGMVCMPWFGLCGLSAPQGYSTSAYCLPCPGSQQYYPNSGAWDFISDPAAESTTNPNAYGEWGTSLDCGDNGKYPYSGEECRIVAHECGGILVNTNGTLISEDCPSWP